MNKHMYIKNDNLKTQANIIFNGLVKNAYIEKYYIFDDEDSKKSYKERLDYFNGIDSSKERDIRYDAERFVLEFNNGSLVEFENSEWASISNISSSQIISN